MIVSIHQPNYIPYPGFFNKIKESDLFIIYDTAQYVKGRWDNRNRIRNKVDSLFLTIPLQDKYSFKLPFNKVKLPENNTWKKKHLKSIKISHAKSNFFNKYIDDLDEIYNKEFDDLSHFNKELITYFMNCLDIKTEIKLSSEINSNHNKKSTEALIEFLTFVNSKHYLSGPSGPNYLDMNRFESAGINVEIQKYKLKQYPQVYNDYIPNLSTMDLLFNMGPDSKNFI